MNRSTSERIRAKAAANKSGYPLAATTVMDSTAELVSALRALYDEQNGPPLLTPRRVAAWEAAMAEAERLLGL